MSTFLLLPILALTPCVNALPHQERATPHLSKRLVYYGSSILGSIFALGFIVFWFGVCIWYMRYRRRVGRPSRSVESIFMRRFFPWMGPPQPVQQPTVIVVNNGGGPPQYPQGMYHYGPLPGQDGYPQSEVYAYGPPGPFEPYPRYQGSAVDRPASPAPVYMGK